MKTSTLTSKIPGNSSPKAVFSHDEFVLRQFNECRVLLPSRLFAKIAALNHTEHKIREETLVLLARHYASKSGQSVAWKLLQELSDRVSLSIGRAVRLWRLSPMVAEEVIESALVDLYDCILDTNDQSRFWEVKFWVCFDRLLLNHLRTHRIKSDKLSRLDPIEDFPFDAVDKMIQPGLNWNDPSLRAVVSEALGQLPDPVRTAFMLKYWAGYPEVSGDPTERATISAVMGVSDRTVRNYLTRAQVILQRWRVGAQPK